jgi:hypothetical protein
VDKLRSKLVFLKPKRLVYFPYPKTADNGTGFGCLMPFFLMEASPSLLALFETVKNNFPPDERHGGLAKLRRCKSECSLLPSMLDYEGLSTKAPVAYSSADSNVRDHGATPTQQASQDPPSQEFSDTFKHLTSKPERSDSFHSLSGGKAYTPHVSIGYLDMSRTDVINEVICKQIEEEQREGVMKKGIRAKYISAWWTLGKVEEWKCIAKVPLMPEFDAETCGSTSPSMGFGSAGGGYMRSSGGLGGGGEGVSPMTRSPRFDLGPP